MGSFPFQRTSPDGQQNDGTADQKSILNNGTPDEVEPLVVTHSLAPAPYGTVTLRRAGNDNYTAF